TVAAVAVTFVCALLVFTLPRFAWNSVQGAIRTPQPSANSAPRPTVPPVPQGAPRSIPQRLTGIFGIALILAIGFALSRNRGAISGRVVAWGVGLQLVFAVFVLRVPFGQTLFSGLGDAVKAILSFSYKGSEFVFGEIGKQQSSLGVVFAFQVLPAIIFVSALFAILYYLGVMQLVVRAFAVLMNRVLGARGAESLNVAASIFMGQTEAPLTIRPLLPGLARSERITVVTAGLARGSSEGLSLMLNVIPMLVSFVALIYLVDGGFGWVHGHVFAWFPEKVETVLGWIFSPIAWAMGVPWHDAGTIGGLLGTRMVLNEFIAYAQLGPLRGQLDPVSFTIATFALCGFANISSVGIQIGGIGALVPERKHDLARLGFRAMIAGTLANFLSATLAGILL